MAAYIIMIIVSLLVAAFFTLKRSNHANDADLVLKTAASLAFIMLGFASYSASAGVTSVLILPGLVMGLVGDIFLDMKYIYHKSETLYTFTGFGAFILGHVFYFVFLVRQYGFSSKGMITGIIVGVIAGIGIFLTPSLMKLDYGRFRVISSLYAALLVFLTVYALCLCITQFSAAKLIFFLGILLFLISDLILSQIYFGRKKNTPLAAVINHGSYYLGQILIAASIFFIRAVQ
mgnify:CR=1 FL=1